MIARSCRPTSTSPSRISVVHRQRRDRRGDGRADVCGRRLREYSRTSSPCLNASSRMPSNLRSKIQSGPVKRSWRQRRGHRLEPLGSRHRSRSTLVAAAAPSQRPAYTADVPGALRTATQMNWSQFEGAGGDPLPGGRRDSPRRRPRRPASPRSARSVRRRGLGRIRIVPGRVSQPRRGDALGRRGHGAVDLVGRSPASRTSDRSRRRRCRVRERAARRAGTVGVVRRLQCVVAVLIASGFPADPAARCCARAIVFGGGLVQTLLVVMIWPLRRFSAERRAIAAAYRSLAAYAAQVRRPTRRAPEPHTFAATLSPSPIRSRSRGRAKCWFSRRCSTKRSGSAPAWRRSRRSSGAGRGEPARAPRSRRALRPRAGRDRRRARGGREPRRTPDLGRASRRAPCARAVAGRGRPARPDPRGLADRRGDDAGRGSRSARRATRRFAAVRRSATR